MSTLSEKIQITSERKEAAEKELISIVKSFDCSSVTEDTWFKNFDFLVKKYPELDMEIEGVENSNEFNTFSDLCAALIAELARLEVNASPNILFNLMEFMESNEVKDFNLDEL